MNKKVAKKMVNHPVRIQILALLANNTMSPSDLSRQIDTTLGTVSYHVRTLKDAKALKLVRKGRVRGAIEHFYTMRDTAKEPIKDALVKMAEERAAAEEALSKF